MISTDLSPIDRWRLFFVDSAVIDGEDGAVGVFSSLRNVITDELVPGGHRNCEKSSRRCLLLRRGGLDSPAVHRPGCNDEQDVANIPCQEHDQVRIECHDPDRDVRAVPLEERLQPQRVAAAVLCQVIIWKGGCIYLGQSPHVWNFKVLLTITTLIDTVLGVVPHYGVNVVEYIVSRARDSDSDESQERVPDHRLVSAVVSVMAFHTLPGTLHALQARDGRQQKHEVQEAEPVEHSTAGWSRGNTCSSCDLLSRCGILHARRHAM